MFTIYIEPSSLLDVILCHRNLLLSIHTRYYESIITLSNLRRIHPETSFDQVISWFQQQHTMGTTFSDETLLPLEDPLASYPRFLHNSLQCLALVRTALVAEEHCGRLDHPLSCIVKDADVTVQANFQVSLLRLKADLSSSVHATPTNNVFDHPVISVQIAALNLRPQDRQAEPN